MKIAFIILTFNSYEMTKRCILSIMRQRNYGNDIKICVVDNASSDDTILKLKRYFSDANMDYIRNSKNVGFSAGNNIGYKYLREKYNPEIIVCINNDTKLHSKNWIATLTQLSKNNDFDILGPDILVPINYIHQNPKCNQIPNQKWIMEEIRSLRSAQMNLKKKSNNFMFFRRCLHRLMYLFNREYKKIQFNVVLHGACIIVGKKAIDSMESLFEPEVFMYAEEYFFAKRVKDLNLKICYNPKLKIYHYQGNNRNGKFDVDREYMKLENMVKSRELYLKYIND